MSQATRVSARKKNSFGTQSFTKQVELEPIYKLGKFVNMLNSIIHERVCK